MAVITDHQVVYADNKTIHYLASGPVKGPLILFIHGWPGTAITWKAQIDAFAAVGFRVIAPDMPGYGKSTARRVVDDYCQEALVEGMMALLADTGRDAAIWVGHDWGAGVTSSVATQHPEAVKALVNICVPFKTVERGWQGFLPFVNREIYPADQYEFGQWDYIKNYQEDFENTIEWFDKDVAGFCKALMQPTKPPTSRIAFTANVRKVGWMNGMPKPPSVEMTGPVVLPAEVFDSFVRDMQTTGFWPGSAYYLHHERNAEYNGKRDGKLNQPVLFIHATWDLVCDTKTSRLIEPMRSACTNLTEATIEAGHFVPYEKPEEVQAAILRFIVEELPSEWPGFSTAGFAKTKSEL
ncbi:Alpha/Beta hydrolase protein [Aspergillus coremiiformis]|uniref:Alpha/Beta hydrolase protein n=1 Tax=Aspergillus coremiiformis TaxID=138285 RepID=A0A5N6Z517_9EURO|nr:Alpha/Beta hydrolase protein [Aspergillus coremiiformis]